MDSITYLFKIERFCIGAPIILLICLIFVGLQSLIRSRIESKSLNPDIVGGFFQVIGTIYAILIGLVVYDATTRFSDAHENVANESKALVGIFMLSGQITPHGVGESIRVLTKDYVEEVLSNDWTHLQNETVNNKARALIRDINLKVLSLSPSNKNEEIVIPLLVQESMDAWRYRMSRFDVSTHRLPMSEWFLLIVGAIITIFCSFFYCLECQRAQSLLTFMTSFVIGISLYAVLMFSEPYKGDFAVSTKPFEIAQQIIDGTYFIQQSLDN